MTTKTDPCYSKTDPNKDFTIKEFYIKVRGHYGKEKTEKRINTLVTQQRLEEKKLSLFQDFLNNL